MKKIDKYIYNINLASDGGEKDSNFQICFGLTRFRWSEIPWKEHGL